MSRLVSRVVAQAIVLPLIVLAITFTSTPAAAASARPAQSDAAVKGGRGYVRVPAHHVSPLVSQNDVGLHVPAMGSFNKPAPKPTIPPGAAPGKPGHPKGQLVPAASTAQPASALARPRSLHPPSPRPRSPRLDRFLPSAKPSSTSTRWRRRVPSRPTAPSR